MSHVMNFLANFISTTASLHDNDDRVEVTFQRNYFKNTNYFVLSGYNDSLSLHFQLTAID